MLKKALKNFYSNLIYVFVAMGIIYLTLILVTYTFLFTVFKGAGTMLSDIFNLLGSTVAGSETAVEQFFEYAKGQINWSNDFVSVVKQIVETDWLKNTVTGFLQTLDVTAENFTSEFNAIINSFLATVVSSFVASVVTLFFGVFVANWVTGYTVRRKTAKRNVLQWVVGLILRPLFNAVVLFAMIWLAAVLKGYALLLFIAVGVVYEFIVLTFSYLMFGLKRVPFRRAINFKNVGMNILAALIIIVINVAVILLIGLINAFVAVLVAVPLLVYSAKILDVNADSYIRHLAKEAGATADEDDILTEAAPTEDDTSDDGISTEQITE